MELAAETSLQDRVRRGLSSFAEAERRVAHALLGEYPMAGLKTVARFARRAQTSGPTILRFASWLGFDSYAAFQDCLQTQTQIRLQGPLMRYPVNEAGAQDYSHIARKLRQNIDGVARNLNAVLPAIVALLSDPDRGILCIRGRFSGLIAVYLHHYLCELRPGVRLVRDSSAAWADDLLEVRPGGIVVVFDFRRYQRDVHDFAKVAAAQGAEIILVTDIWYSPIAAFVTILVPCPVSLPTSFDSGVTGLAVVEIVTAGIVDALGIGARDRIARLDTLRKPLNLGS